MESKLFIFRNRPCDVESIKRFEWELMARPNLLEGANYLGNDDHMVRYSWVAVAFSADQRLGRDLVFPCTNAPDGKNVSICLIRPFIYSISNI